MTEAHEALRVGPGDAGQRLDALISAQLPALSRTRAAALIVAGEVAVEGVAAAKVVPGLKVRAGWQVTVRVPAPPPSELIPWHDAGLQVVYEDAELLVIDKPAGMVVHPGAGHWERTLVHAILGHAPDLAGVGAIGRPGLVHRIDKDTTGLLVVSKTPAAHARLAADFARHDIERHYLAVVHGRMAVDRLDIESGHARDPRDRRRFTGKLGGRRAVTHLTVFARCDVATLVVATLETGRTHQIRMHLAERGHPLVGDALYGGQRTVARTARTAAQAAAIAKMSRQALHAMALGVRQPTTGAWLQWTSPPPPDLLAMITALFGEAALAAAMAADPS